MKRLTQTLLVLALLAPAPALALTAGEVMDKLTSTEGASFTTGAVDMFAYLNPDKAECALKWFNEQGGTTYTYKVYEKYPDKPAAAILGILIKRNCPDNAVKSSSTE